MWQQFMIQSMPMALKLPGWMTNIKNWFGDRFDEAANAMYETVLSPMLTWLGGIMFAQGRALLNCGFSIWKSCTQVAASISALHLIWSPCSRYSSALQLPYHW